MCGGVGREPWIPRGCHPDRGVRALRPAGIVHTCPRSRGPVSTSCSSSARHDSTPNGSAFFQAASWLEWAAIREQVLTRAGWRFQACGLRRRLDVHHVVKRSQGGSDFDLDRLVALCRWRHDLTDAPYERGGLVVTALGEGQLTFEVVALGTPPARAPALAHVGEIQPSADTPCRIHLHFGLPINARFNARSTT
jgi:hypothetical protein